MNRHYPGNDDECSTYISYKDHRISSLQSIMSVEYEITNIVSIWNLGQRIDLPENDYKGRKRFNGWIKKDGKKTCIAFASGKVTTTGFKSLADVAVTIKIMFPDYDSFLEKIVSIAVKSFLPYQIDKRKFFNEPDIIYEPELFPAALWYYNKICLMFFHTNSIVMNGLQRFSDIEIVLAAFMKRALPFKKV
uniref:Uncharacterized protein n=1 Tax=Tetranychus urticae TaxID=32264 RepID=T1KXE8_TETUR